jgi:processive 1,2-diacylglycerol beta-glucosyltransferase
VKRILILTAGYGEGHNAAARGVRDGLTRVAPDVDVDLRDLFAETFGTFHQLVRKSYLGLINRWPRTWGYVYRWLDRKKDFDRSFARFVQTKKRLKNLLDAFQPDAVVSAFPAYPYLLNQVSGPNPRYKNVVVITDSITVNAIWYRSPADYFLVPNEPSADVVHAAGIAAERIKTFGFPVSPKFADLAHLSRRSLAKAEDRQAPSQTKPRVLYMINAGTRTAPEVVSRLLDLDIHLTVTVGHDEKLRRAIEIAVGDRKVDIVGWTDQMPRLLSESHLLIGKAGGATVQETIAASCPMIINHIVSGQEEGNARLIVETNSGVIARSPTEIVAQVQRAFADDAKQWREWSTNINKLSRPRASLDIAEFLLSI